MKQYKAGFYRDANVSEIGPHLETQEFAATSKTNAIKTAKKIAKNNNWRFLELIN